MGAPQVSTKDKWTLVLMSDAAEQSSNGSEGRFRRRRRRWSEAPKRRIVAESYQPGVSVSVVARRHDVNANQVFTWRRQYRELARATVGVVSVVVSSTDEAQPAKLLPTPEDIEPPPSSRIEIALADGSRVTVDRDADAAALSRGSGAAMTPVPSGVRVWLATGVTDMRRGMNTLALQV